ncbi:unnamed protein product [Phytophthora fragariaefolia]|uniref:Unnamed protein product n=1 Tax=Phytophthora fragariaefolia TaxID=1490495 RepID=A0A9W6TX73_9STRA|nr:unnamed protein product [Phytophthora fragariaefolia]
MHENGRIQSENGSEESQKCVHHISIQPHPVSGMLVLRVRCVDDGRELLLERHGANAHSIQVAELKALVLQQRQHLNRSGAAANLTDAQDSGLEECFVLLRGQILADPDVVDLNALGPSDFFVFASDAPQPRGGSGSSGEMQSGGADPAVLEVLRSQLVDMGFSSERAMHALRQSSNNLVDAAALLVEGKVALSPGGKVSMDDEEIEPDLHPSIAPLRSLMHDENMMKLRELAAIESFQALTLLKEVFSSETLNQLNENPVATLRLLSMPAPTGTESLETAEYGEDKVIDVKTSNWSVSPSCQSNGAVDRVSTNSLIRCFSARLSHNVVFVYFILVGCSSLQWALIETWWKQYMNPVVVTNKWQPMRCCKPWSPEKFWGRQYDLSIPDA